MFFGRIRSSIRVRLAALFVLIFGAALALFSGLLYSAFVRSDQNDFDIALYNHAIDTAEGIDVDLLGNVTLDPDALSPSGKIFPFSVGKAYTQVLDRTGRLVGRSHTLGDSRLPFFTEDLEMLNIHSAVFRTIREQGADYRLITYLAHANQPGRYVLQIAVPMSFLEQEERGLLTLILIFVPIALAVGTLGGLYLSGRALAPVAAIIEKARGLSPARLGERVPVPEADDELRQLSLTLNRLLDRMQQAFESQDRFVADASHELKTPLAILRGELDLMKSRARTPQETTEFVESASQEIDHLSRMVENLLLLARVDAGIASLSVRKVGLDEVALEATARLEPLARRKNIKLRFDLHGPPGFEVEGDPDLLQSMLKNLIENAIKFSPESGVVEVMLENLGDSVVARVTDQGPGIAPEAAARVFERFFRSGTGRAPGTGLGLTIAQRIAEAHHGKIELKTSPEGGPMQGAVFVVTLGHTLQH